MSTVTSDDSLVLYRRDLEGSDSDPLSREQEVELTRRIRLYGDEEARWRLYTANTRFVVGVAKQYLGYAEMYGLSLLELVSEGNMGLLEATRRFDERRGFKFITYAVWWIRQSILESLSHQPIVGRSTSLPSDIRKVDRAISILEQRLGRSPDMGEISKQARMKEWVMLRAIYGRRDVSLDSPPKCYDEDSSFYDFLEDDSFESPDEGIQRTEQEEGIEYLLGCLDERERKVIRMYYGLEGNEPMTLEKIGSLMGVTRERVRQIKEEALGKMRGRAKREEFSLSDVLSEG